MVEVKRGEDRYGWPVIKVQSEWDSGKYTITKANNGYAAYVFQTGEDLDGQVPEALRGWFTTPDKALDFLLTYLRNRGQTTAAKRNQKTRLAQEWKEKNAAKPRTNDKKHVQQGASD